MSPAGEERSLPLPERWPRASKFALSACAAAVAELGTTHRGFPRGKGGSDLLTGGRGNISPWMPHSSAFCSSKSAFHCASRGFSINLSVFQDEIFASETEGLQSLTQCGCD